MLSKEAIPPCDNVGQSGCVPVYAPSSVHGSHDGCGAVSSTTSNGAIAFTTDIEFSLFASNDLENENLADGLEHDNIIGRNALRILTSSWRGNAGEILNFRTLRAIFYARDPHLMRGFRFAFQQGFEHLYTQLQGKTLTANQQLQAQLFLSNCLSLLPFADIGPYECFKIPQYVAGSWQSVTFKVTPIELTAQSGWATVWLNDARRVFAYGLEPVNNQQAQPWLLFMGTTYPAGQGFLTQIATDLEPFATVGTQLYRTGVGRISEWIHQQQPHKPMVCGVSLGGSLSLLLAIHQHTILDSVYVQNPAGLHQLWGGSEFDQWPADTKLPVYIQRQNNDPVSRLGDYKPGMHLLDIVAPANQKGPNPFFDHFINYLGFLGTAIKEGDIAEDNAARWWHNLMVYTIGRTILYGTLISGVYVLSTSLSYMLAHPHDMLFLGAGAALFAAFPALVVPLVGTSWVVNFTLNALLCGAFGHVVWAVLQDMIWQKADSIICQSLYWAREQHWVAQSLLGAALLALMVGSMALSSSVAVACYVWMSLPVLANVVYAMGCAYHKVLGTDAALPAQLHQPQQPRNASMDVYRVSCSIEVPVAELLSYEKAKIMLTSDRAYEFSEANPDQAAAKIAITDSVATISAMQALVKTGMFATSACYSEQERIAVSIIADYKYGKSAGDAVCVTV